MTSILCRRIARHVSRVYNARISLASLPQRRMIGDLHRSGFATDVAKGSVKDETNVPLSDRVKEMIKLYGIPAVVFHSSLYCISLGSCFVAIRNGLDSQALLTSWGVSSAIPPEAGELAAAWVVCAATGPIRGAITIGAAPIISRVLMKHKAATSIEDKAGEKNQILATSIEPARSEEQSKHPIDSTKRSLQQIS